MTAVQSAVAGEAFLHVRGYLIALTRSAPEGEGPVAMRLTVSPNRPGKARLLFLGGAADMRILVTHIQA